MKQKILASLDGNIVTELINLRKVTEQELEYFRSEGFTNLMRRPENETDEYTNIFKDKKYKKYDETENIHVNMTDFTSKNVKNTLKFVNNEAKRKIDAATEEAKKYQDPKINSIVDLLRRKGQSHAEGLDVVPYDGYVAELHKGERIVPSDESSIGTVSEKEKFKMLNSIKRHTRIIADEIKGQLYGVGNNLHNIRKILQHMSGLKNDDVSIFTH